MTTSTPTRTMTSRGPGLRNLESVDPRRRRSISLTRVRRARQVPGGRLAGRILARGLASSSRQTPDASGPEADGSRDIDRTAPDQCERVRTTRPTASLPPSPGNAPSPGRGVHPRPLQTTGRDPAGPAAHQPTPTTPNPKTQRCGALRRASEDLAPGLSDHARPGSCLVVVGGLAFVAAELVLTYRPVSAR
jgi:hypothetical protein